MNEIGLRDSLSITYAQCIVQGHDGVMTLRGVEGSSSVMQILLPASESRPSQRLSGATSLHPAGRSFSWMTMRS